MNHLPSSHPSSTMPAGFQREPILNRIRALIEEQKKQEISLEQLHLDSEIRAFICDYYALEILGPTDRDIRAARIHGKSTRWLEIHHQKLTLEQQTITERIIDLSFIAWKYPQKALMEISY